VADHGGKRLLVAAPGSVEEGGSDLDSRARRGHGEHASVRRPRRPHSFGAARRSKGSHRQDRQPPSGPAPPHSGALYLIVYGSNEEASYSASDPDLMHWVHATLVEASLAAYRRFVGQLTPEKEEAYYGEMALVRKRVRVVPGHGSRDVGRFPPLPRGPARWPGDLRHSPGGGTLPQSSSCAAAGAAPRPRAPFPPLRSSAARVREQRQRRFGAERSVTAPIPGRRPGRSGRDRRPAQRGARSCRRMRAARRGCRARRFGPVRAR
jgi:hypothetical protein